MPDPDLEIRVGGGGGGGGSKKRFFPPFGPQFGLKIMGEPEPLPWIRHGNSFDKGILQSLHPAWEGRQQFEMFNLSDILGDDNKTERES